jgi:putative transposase
VALCEALRWPGRILGASVSREADHCFLSVQVEVPEQDARRRRSCDGITGVDLGVSSVATLSSGEKIAAPRPLRAALDRLRIRARVRRDSTHKLTTRLCRENQTVVLEDLHVSGMLANGRLSRAIADVGFYEIRRQLQYNAARYGTRMWWRTGGTRPASSVRSVVSATAGSRSASARGPVPAAARITTAT